jgi:sialic acid synthase SpsE
MTEHPLFEVRGRRVGPDAPLFAIAEIGLNHGGSADRALALVDAAARAGAAAVKLQSLRAAHLVAPVCPAPAHVEADSLQAFFARFELDEAAHRAVAARAHEAGLAFLSTPFDEAAVDMLVRAGADALKVASGDITHHRLIARAAATGLPLIVSTGMSALAEVESAVACARDAGASRIALLHCVSAYPVPAGSENLRAIHTLETVFGGPVGLSDHGLDPLAVPVAVAMGASIYERHVVLAAGDGSIDEAVSSTGEDLAARLALAERARRMLGDGRRACSPAEAPNLTASRRGVYAARRLAAGTRVGPDDIICLRPAHAVPADEWRRVIDCRVRVDVDAGTPLEPAMLEASCRS